MFDNSGPWYGIGIMVGFAMCELGHWRVNRREQKRAEEAIQQQIRWMQENAERNQYFLDAYGVKHEGENQPRAERESTEGTADVQAPPTPRLD